MLRGSYDASARWLGEARSLVPPGAHAAEIEGKIGELAFKRGDVRTAADSVERALRMIGRRVPRRRVVLLPLLGGELVVQMLHSLSPAVFVGRRSVDRGATDLLASRFHGRLGYAWWFERGKIATLWTHLRSMNLAERYPPTAELARAYSEHAPAMMLIPWHRRGVRYARQSHAIRAQLGDRWGQGQSLHFWGAGLYAASEYDASLTRMREALELLEQTGDQWELNNCRLQTAMARYRLGDLAGAAEDAKRHGTRDSTSAIPKPGGSGSKRGRNPPTDRSPNKRSAPSWSARARTSSRSRASCRQRECASSASMSPRRPSGRSRRASGSSDEPG